jgi:mannose-6-phosphate isomerase-like protein (cupin superfamily)
MRALKILMLLLLAAAPAAAQSKRAAKYYSTGQLRRIVSAADTASAHMSSTVLDDLGGFNYVVARRDQSGVVEIHREWDDVIVMQEGTAVMRHSGNVSGSKETTPGEFRGGTMTGGVSQPVGPGDVLEIPAGVPHQFQLKPGTRIRYFVVKAQARPKAAASPAKR